MQISKLKIKTQYSMVQNVPWDLYQKVISFF